MALKKKLILVAAPPASGKTYVCERLAEAMGHAVYLDKDDLSDLLRAAFRASGNEINMDGEFYVNNLRASEYSTLLNIAFSVLRFEDTVIVGAPFGKEVRDTEYMRALKGKAGISYLNALVTPLSHIKFLAVGGVNHENLADYLKAGAKGVGVATAIADKAAISRGDYDEITRRAKMFTEKI